MPSSHEPVPQRRSRGCRRAGAVALLGAIALAAGGTSAQASVGGSAPATSAAATLQSGSTGSAVRQLQRELGLRADGHFGPRTRRALVRWQRRHGVRADGVAGPATLKALGIRARTSRAPAGGGTASPALQRIAQCESGGNPTAVSANGRYHGKYQFSVATWRAMGGEGLPSRASEAEQDRLAAKLHASQGTAPWPVCGARG
jgi:peptidoglycan hydrolase-like protein with peptidoglycan-binding domain